MYYMNPRPIAVVWLRYDRLVHAWHCTVTMLCIYCILWYPNIIDGTNQNVSTEEMKHYCAKPSVNCTSYSDWCVQLIGKLSQQCRTRCKVTRRMHYKTVYHAYARSADLVHTKNLSKGKKRSWQSTQADEPGRVIRIIARPTQRSYTKIFLKRRRRPPEIMCGILIEDVS